VLFGKMIYVFQVTGRGSTIVQTHYPAIELDPLKSYGIALLSIDTYNSIPNILEGANKFYYDSNKVITIPVGAYELADINAYLKKIIGKKNIELAGNLNTQQTNIECIYPVDFTPVDSIGTLMGFAKKIYPPGTYQSEHIVNITKVHAINVECNVAQNSYKNGAPDRTIYQLVPRVPPGYRIDVSPLHLIFFPINTRFIETLEFTLTDQDNLPVDFQNEPITIRVMLKEIKNENYF
jgi:hypothetical protein